MNGGRRDGDSGQRDGNPPRLLEGEPAGQAPSAQWALELLRSAAPYQTPPGRKQRVQLTLGHAGGWRAGRVLRPALAAVTLVGLGAVASAAVGARLPGWVTRAVDRVVATVHPVRPVALVEPPPAPDAVQSAIARPQAPAPAMTSPPPAPAIAPVAEAPGPTPRPRRAARPSGGEGTAVLMDAMRALRVERNPVRARALLGAYLQQHPNGALAEEALAMSIEAAVAHRDPDAPLLARRYLRLYPEGPFGSVARQALATP